MYYQRPRLNRSQMLTPNLQDMITWDPRGMARSTSRQQCWSTPQRNALYMSSQPGDASEYDDIAHLNALRRNWMTVSAACNDLSARTANNIHRYVSTYQHAHDMRSVMRAMGDTDVNFYGISWGTTLGMYFASLFPDLVGRMILEGESRKEARPISVPSIIEQTIRHSRGGVS